MYKFVIILVAALASQAVFASSVHDHQQRQKISQELQQLIHSVSNDASNSVQNVQVDNQQGKHVLVSEANELAHHVHEVIYHLQQVIGHNHDGQGQQVLQQVASNLNDVVHAVQQALRHEPSQLQSQLKVQIGNIAAQAEKLTSVIQQQQQSEEVNNELLIVLDDLVVAVQQVNVINKLQNQNQQEIKNHVQAVVNEVSNVIQGVNSNAADASSHLAHVSHHLAHHLGEVINDVHREVRHQHGEVSNVVRQVVNKLQEVRVSLEQAQSGSSVNDLKSQLKTNVHSIGAQIERLIQLVHSNNANEQEIRNLRGVVHNILAHSLAAARQLQRNVDDLVENNQKN